MAAGLNIAGLQLDTAPLAQHEGEQVSYNSRSQMSVSIPSSPTALSLASPEGIDCYGNERQVLSDQAKFYNNSTLSDITLVVGGNKYYAHKLILVRSSDVFERMLSKEWSDGSKKVNEYPYCSVSFISLVQEKDIIDECLFLFCFVGSCFDRGQYVCQCLSQVSPVSLQLSCQAEY